MSGSREEAWGKKKKFREGQEEQVLDTLFFDFIDLARELQPKVVVAENVKGLLIGEAKDYVRQIYDGFEEAGYYCQHWLLDAQYMGVPQRRERVFFICLRKDLATPFLACVNLFEQQPKIDMDFNEGIIPFGKISDYKGREQCRFLLKMYDKRVGGDKSYADVAMRVLNKNSYFNEVFVKENEVVPTIRANASLPLFSKPIVMSDMEIIKASTFPIDYKFGTQKPVYVCGMSVPPVMMANIASRIYEQWISKF